MVTKLESTAVMKKHFPRCPVCKSTKGYDVRGLGNTELQCRSCGAKWRVGFDVAFSGELKTPRIKSLKLLKADMDGRAAPLLKKEYAPNVWKSFSSKKIPKIPKSKTISYHRKNITVFVTFFVMILVVFSLSHILSPARLDYPQTFTLRNPTFDEAVEFMLRDPTSENQHVENVYVCLDFSRDTVQNAYKQGLRAAIVIISLENSISHALVAFEATDWGTVFFEPQTDEIKTVEIGQPYWENDNVPVSGIKLYWPENWENISV